MANSTSVIAAALPEYEIQRELGRGAMGVVYLGRHRRLERLVAVKELPAEFGVDPAMRHRFGVEARVLATLNHPHVVPVFDYVESNGVCLLVMEALPGGTVWERFTTDGLSMPQACAVILATCSALEHAHGQGILHRDIKPENLMFGANDAVKVTDFGIAKVLGGSRTMATVDGSVLGTPAYMAPEQAEGKELTAQVDVYATGTMLYEMLSGRLPFERGDSVMGMLVARVTDDPTPLRDKAPEVPEPLAAVVMTAIARDLERRYHSAEEFGCALGSAAASAWGPEWLSTSGLVVQGSEPISRAARTTVAEPVARDATIPPDQSATVLRPRVEGESLLPASDGMPPLPAAGPPVPPGPGPTVPAPATVVRPQAVHPDVVFDVAAVARGELVDISEVLKPPGAPIASIIVGLVVFFVGIAVAAIGLGEPKLDQVVPAGVTQVAGTDVATTSAIEIDLDDVVRVEGVLGDRVELSLSLLGVPLGTTNSAAVVEGIAEVDPGIVARTASGAVTGTLTVFDAAGNEIVTHDVALEATNAWYLTAMGIVAILVVLFAAASVESNLRLMRRGRLRIGSLFGLGVSGALVGAGTALLTTAGLATPRTIQGVIAPAVICAAGAMVFGVAAARNGRRRRVKRRLEAGATR